MVWQWLEQFIGQVAGLILKKQAPVREVYSEVLEACLIRGRQALLEGFPEQAIKALGLAARLQPDSPEIQLELGRAFQHAGRIEAARKAFLRAREIAPTLPVEPLLAQ